MKYFNYTEMFTKIQKASVTTLKEMMEEIGNAELYDKISKQLRLKIDTLTSYVESKGFTLELMQTSLYLRKETTLNGKPYLVTSVITKGQIEIFHYEKLSTSRYWFHMPDVRRPIIVSSDILEMILYVQDFIYA